MTARRRFVFTTQKNKLLECAAFVKDPNDVCRIFNLQDFSFSGEYFQKENKWHGKVHIPELNYNVSYDSPYSSEYSMFFFFRSESMAVIITLTMPSIKGIKLSGLHVQVGIMGVNFYNVAEEASALICGWSDKALRDVINKEFTDANSTSGLLDSNSNEDDPDSDYYDKEGDCYE